MVLKCLNFYYKVYFKFYRIINDDFLVCIKNRRYWFYVNVLVGFVFWMFVFIVFVFCF